MPPKAPSSAAASPAVSPLASARGEGGGQSRRGRTTRFDEDGSGSQRASVPAQLARLAVLVAAVMAIRWTGLLGHVRNPVGLYQPAYRVGVTAGSIALSVILLVLVWKYLVQRGVSYRHLRMRARRPLVVIIVSELIAFVAFSLAFWPVYGIKGPFLFALLSYALLCLLSFV